MQLLRDVQFCSRIPSAASPSLPTCRYHSLENRDHRHHKFKDTRRKAEDDIRCTFGRIVINGPSHHRAAASKSITRNISSADGQRRRCSPLWWMVLHNATHRPRIMRGLNASCAVALAAPGLHQFASRPHVCAFSLQHRVERLTEGQSLKANRRLKTIV